MVLKFVVVSKWVFVSLYLLMYRMIILGAALSKACACQRSLVGIVSSNPDGTQVFFSYECCVFPCGCPCDGMKLVQTSPTECGVSNYCEVPRVKRRREMYTCNIYF